MKHTLFDTAKPRTKKQAIDVLDQLRAAGIPDPLPEYKFAKGILGRDWAFDWAWRIPAIALEVEGALFGGRVINVKEGFEYRTVKGVKVHVPIAGIVRLGGGHNTGERLVRDLEKYNYANILGWCVIRVSTTMVRDQQVVPLVRQAFQYRGVNLPPERTADERAEAKHRPNRALQTPW